MRRLPEPAPPIETGKSLRLLTTLKAGGNAEEFTTARTVDGLAHTAEWAWRNRRATTVLGSGSNILPSDSGVPGLVVFNQASKVVVTSEETVTAESGAAFQDVFLCAAQAGLSGLEFAVGIPGTIGGAVVSNAGAYRSDIGSLLTEVEIVHDGQRKWVAPEYLQLSYRDSILRRPEPPHITVLRLRLQLALSEPRTIYDTAREFQRQRIGKQPPQASAGSFFKNVIDPDLANTIEGLTEGMRENGVVPAGVLIESCGLKGHRHQGAMVGQRHANFLLNTGGATATAIRQLAEHVTACVHEKYGVTLEEEVLYLGDWTSHVNQGKIA